MQELLGAIRRVAPHTISIVLLGETGTGKEVLARELHLASGRSGPFVALNCAALPPSLAESELFGHARGAFTGACSDRKGLFEQASGGTFLLDEVGELDLALQGKLLRVLETGEVRPIGAARSIPTDCRIVAATNRCLEDMVAAHLFREDLYHRLAGVVLTVPPLRKRPDDIAPLLELFLSDVAAGGTPPLLSPDTLDALCRRPWRGNVRELRQVVFRAVVLGGHMLTPRDFQPLAATAQHSLPSAAWLRGKRFKDIEREAYVHALTEAGTIRGAAALLGLPHSTLADRVQHLNLGSFVRSLKGRPPAAPLSTGAIETTPLRSPHP
jgi:two-component system response regulator HupR/HoxA